ncbi:hypothetical protein [Brevibacterium otitidis]|uniref:Gram-positive cocci surface proteins LPxTG domain-containing protein n=1 Tax=Brevibacterium otitidis TaxID=53364 RepID=A0ABV5WZK4_9MICO|nr:hypothetical protein GCM10023233_27870 [Brevibacterium otitidis]
MGLPRICAAVLVAFAMSAGVSPAFAQPLGGPEQQPGNHVAEAITVPTPTSSPSTSAGTQQHPAGEPSSEAPSETPSSDTEMPQTTEFVREDAVVISAAGCAPNTEATMTVVPQGMNVGNYSEMTMVDADGTVGFTVTADAAPSAEPRTNPGGQEDRGTRLPRTGSDLLAAAAGAILLTVGTASVMFTRRRD